MDGASAGGVRAGSGKVNLEVLLKCGVGFSSAIGVNLCQNGPQSVNQASEENDSEESHDSASHFE